MKNEELKSKREEGKQVWYAVQAQLAEGSGFLRAMLDSFRSFVRKQFLSFFLYGIVAAALAAGFWYLKPKLYEAEMTVSYIHYEKKIYADMLQKLDRLVEARSYVSLGQLLSLPAETTSKLRGIRGYNIRHESLAEDLSTERVPFYIQVSVIDLSVLKDLQSALVNYLDGTDFIQERLSFMKRKSEEELEFLILRLSVVDSLSRMLNIKEDKMLSEKTVTRMELLEETMTLFSKIQEVKGSLAFNNNIEVLDGFVANDRPMGSSLVTFVLYGFLIGLALRLLVLAFT
jgi:hypothetical protein